MARYITLCVLLTTLSVLAPVAAGSPASTAVPGSGGARAPAEAEGRQPASPPPLLVVHLAAAGAAGQGTAGEVPAAVRTTARALGLQRRHHLEALDAVVYRTPAGDLAGARRQLARLPGVAAVRRDARAHAFRTPNDPRLGDQWGLRQIAAPSAWDATVGRSEVTIAVLDTGVDADHADLAANVASGGANFTDDGARSDTSDAHGHGTGAAGVAAATTDNATGIAGACWRCEILPVKVLNDEGGGVVSDVAAGVEYAVDAGADVLSLSLGASSGTRLLEEAIDHATQQGVAVVASAGNYGDQAEVYPAAYEDVIGVVASDRDDERYGFSSYGSWAEIAAPGCNSATALDDAYKSFCGTSSSAPLVAGTLGLALSVEPDAGVVALRQALRQGSVPFDGAAWGRMDAAATLAALPEVSGDEDTADAPTDEDPTPAPDPDQEYDTGPGVTVRRMSGANRFATAARMSREAFEPGGLLDELLDSEPDRAYVASGATFPDALAAGAAAGHVTAPVLLTAPRSLPPSTIDELERLDPSEVVVVGGTAAVSQATAEAAGDAATASVRRIAGDGRFATAAAVALDTFGASTEVAYVATGADYPDALAGVPAAVADDAPVLLTAGDRLPAPTRDALRQLSLDRVVVLGGPEAVSRSVADALTGLVSGSVERIAGQTRFATAAKVAQRFAAGSPAAYLATGLDWPDALAAGPVAGIHGSPLLLVTRDRLPEVTAAQLRRVGPAANVTMGGTNVISQEVQAQAADESTAGT